MKNMKRISLLLMCTAVLAGCSKENGTGKSGIPGDRTVRLQAGLSARGALEAETKSPVNTGDRFMAAVGGWETAGAVNYGVAKSWLSSAEIIASTIRSEINLTPSQDYPEDATTKTYMKAWYPAGTLADNGTVTFSGTPDGTTDVLLAGQVVGASNDASVKTLSFIHPLTQLKFKVQKSSDFAGDITLTSIKIKDAQLPRGIKLTTDEIIYAAAADLTVPGITAGTIALTSTSAVAGLPVMIKPFPGKTCTLEVTTSASTYTDVTVTIDEDKAFVPGKAYTVTLYFGNIEKITVGSTVAEWTSGTGSGQIID